MKTYKFNMYEGVETDNKKVDNDPKKTEKKEKNKIEKSTSKQSEKKQKKPFPIFGIAAVIVAVLGFGISLFAIVCACLPSIVEFCYNFIYYLGETLYIFDLEPESGFLYDTIITLYYSSPVGDYYEYSYYYVTHFHVAVELINHWRDILLLIVSVVGALISGVSLLANIKGKNHLATGLGATALSISLVAGVNLIASIVSYFQYGFWSFVMLVGTAISGLV